MKLDLYDAGLVDQAARDRNEPKVKDGETPCLLCGKGCRSDNTRVRWFWLHGGGGVIITELRDAADLGGDSADLGMYPIGSDCYRRHRKALEPFLAIQEEEADGEAGGR